MNFSKDKKAIQSFRQEIELGRDYKDMDEFKSKCASTEDAIKKMGYCVDVLYINDEVFNKLFGFPEVIEADYLIKKGEGHE